MEFHQLRKFFFVKKSKYFKNIPNLKINSKIMRGISERKQFQWPMTIDHLETKKFLQRIFTDCKKVPVAQHEKVKVLSKNIGNYEINQKIFPRTEKGVVDKIVMSRNY